MSDHKKKKTKRKTLFLIFLIGFIAAFCTVAIINAVASRLTKSEFCGNACHEMPGVYKGWLEAAHHNNSAGMITECADCHLPPREQYFTRLADECYQGTKNLYIHYFGKPYDPNAMRAKVLRTMPDSRCIRCHNNLLAKPSSTASRLAHETSLDKSDPNAPRCVDAHCHPVMHERKGN